MKRRWEDPILPLFFHVSYRAVKFREPIDPLGAAIALRAEYLVGSEVRVVTDGWEEHSINVDSVCRELFERAMRILFETTAKR